MTLGVLCARGLANVALADICATHARSIEQVEASIAEEVECFKVAHTQLVVERDLSHIAASIRRSAKPLTPVQAYLLKVRLQHKGVLFRGIAWQNFRLEARADNDLCARREVARVSYVIPLRFN